MYESPKKTVATITEWLKKKLTESGMKGFVLGVSGGIDSAVVSTLCAKTEENTLLLSMPINQAEGQLKKGEEHIKWLEKSFSKVSSKIVDLTPSFETFKNSLPDVADDYLAMANSRSRLRMTTLYAYANHLKFIVSGTGNKIEDFGVFFYTKYGDGGVDISPIGDLTKTQVYEVGRYLGICESILTAKPTDGLWDDGRSDEDQIGASYPELEWAMDFSEKNPDAKAADLCDLTDRQIEILNIYQKRHAAGRHKMDPIPVCTI